MKLLVDIGNSRIKWACLDTKGLSASSGFDRSKSGIKAGLSKAWKHLEGICEIHVSNVAGEKIATQLAEWTEKNWQLKPNFIQAEKRRFGVTNAYDQPEKLGVDRWLGLVAMRQHAKETTCIIDCGTAITIDIVTEKGQHQGGMILPGLSLMRSALIAHTDGLTDIVEETDFNLLATNTFSAIQAGTLYSISATLENVIADLQLNFNQKIRFVMSGGDAEKLLQLLPADVQYEPEMVMKGLALYARQRKGPAKQKHNPKKTDSAHTEETDTTTLPEGSI